MTLTPELHSLYATRIYLPFSSFARHLRALSGDLRGKPSTFLQRTRLTSISWRSFPHQRPAGVWETTKQNGNVRISELAILSSLAAACPAGTILFEIGTFDGRTTLNLAMNAPDSCPIHTLDLPPGHGTVHALAKGEKHMVEKPESGSRYERYRSSHPAKIARIHQHYGDSANFDYSPWRGQCGLVFVDGSHAYPYAISDTRTALSLVRPGGIIIWHDYGVWEGVTRALEEIGRLALPGLRHIRGTSLVCWQATL